MEIFNQVLFWINWVLLGLCSAAFGLQLLYVFFFWLPAKKYKAAEHKHRIGVIIPARNEESVIGDTVKCLLNSDYPRDKFDVFVVADNCTDLTAQVARDAGAIVFEHFDDDPKHKRAGYALKYGFEQIMKDYDHYELFVKFDADNLMEPNYLSKMNDAFDAGVKSARGYSNSKNITENVVAGISGLWYIRDCRYACQVRSFLNTSQMLGGAGMMFSAEIIKKHGGWDCLTTSDDAEFAMNRLLEGVKTKYVHDAIVYEDQPVTLKDTYKRYKRMGNGLFKLFFTKGIPSLGKFFYKFGYSYIDMFLHLLFVPIAVVCCLWMPLYYGYDVIYNYVLATPDSIAYANSVLINLGYILAFAFVVPFILQALLAAVLERKRLKINKFSQLLPAIFSFPAFMIVYAIAITIGVFSKPKWGAVARSQKVNAADILAADSSATRQEDDLPFTAVPVQLSGAEISAADDVEGINEIVEPRMAEDEAVVKV